MPSRRKKTGDRKRAPRGSGNPFYKKATGKWICVHSRTIAGKRHRTEFSGTTPEEAISKYRAAVERGLLRAGPMDQRPLGDWMQSWMDECAIRLKPKTIADYESLCNLHLLPYIGTVRLAEIDAQIVANLLTALRKYGAGKRTIDKTRAVLSSALETAWRRGLITSNPVRLVPGSGYEAPERNTLSFDECARMFIEIMRYRQGAIGILAATMGMRLGEILALRWNVIDFERRELRIVSELSYVRGKIHFVAPKTKRSRRTLRIPAVACDALQIHRERMRSEQRAEPDGLVFVTRSGQPQKPTGLARDLLRPALKRAGVRTDITIHDLRHSLATNMGRSGVPVHVVSAILGHSRRSTTLDIYTHAFDDDTRSAMGIVDRRLRVRLSSVKSDAKKGDKKTRPTRSKNPQK